MGTTKDINEKNNVNELDGKHWLRNAINFWEFDSISDKKELEEKMISFSYKKRESGEIYSNYLKEKEIANKRYDLTINYVKSFEDFDNKLPYIIGSGYNSYHYIIIDNEICDHKLLSKYIVDACEQNGLEYRGRIIAFFKNESESQIVFLMLNRITEEPKEKIMPSIIDIKTTDEIKSHFIYSKSKIDKIGLKHPAPYSYNDIEKICELENINNSTILDPFIGIGSTIIGSYKYGNYNIGIDLNPEYISLIDDRFKLLNIEDDVKNKYEVINGDSTEAVRKLKTDINYVITSPPYFNILKNKNKGVRHDNSQSRQGVEFYSLDEKDIGNIDEYSNYIDAMKKVFCEAGKKITPNGKIYVVISDFTVNKKEKDVHSDFMKMMGELGYKYSGTSYIIQNQKSIYPFGYPYKLVLNHIFQYVMCFEVNK